VATALTTVEKQIMAKLTQLAQRYEQIEQQMQDPAIAGDHTRIIKFAREHSQLKELVGCYYRYQKLHGQLEEVQTMLAEAGSDAEMRALTQQEVSDLQEQLAAAMEQAKALLVMADDVTIGSVIMEIRAGTGGEEAALFVADLYGMYTRYAEKRGWKVEQLDFSSTDMGGFREVIMGIKGPGVWQALGYEGGGHRVQRVPETETQGRIHTSAATVAVLPEPEELLIEIKPEDVLEHVSRAGGPGGQNVNKVSSAIKLEHIPTGITVSMRDEKSQHKNRAKAWRILRSRLYDYHEQKKRAQRSSARREMIGSGDRSQRIRTYNFPQNRLTDHRINVSLYSLEKIIMGDMDDLIAALIDYDKQQRLENL